MIYAGPNSSSRKVAEYGGNTFGYGSRSVLGSGWPKDLIKVGTTYLVYKMRRLYRVTSLNKYKVQSFEVFKICENMITVTLYLLEPIKQLANTCKNLKAYLKQP